MPPAVAAAHIHAHVAAPDGPLRLLVGDDAPGFVALARAARRDDYERDPRFSWPERRAVPPGGSRGGRRLPLHRPHGGAGLGAVVLGAVAGPVGLPAALLLAAGTVAVAAAAAQPVPVPSTSPT